MQLFSGSGCQPAAPGDWPLPSPVWVPGSLALLLPEGSCGVGGGGAGGSHASDDGDIPGHARDLEVTSETCIQFTGG